MKKETKKGYEQRIFNISFVIFTDIRYNCYN